MSWDWINTTPGTIAILLGFLVLGLAVEFVG